MQASSNLLLVLLIVLAGMGILAVLLTMGYMVYGNEEEE
jgi:hypothetical protein